MTALIATRRCNKNRTEVLGKALALSEAGSPRLVGGSGGARPSSTRCIVTLLCAHRIRSNSNQKLDDAIEPLVSGDEMVDTFGNFCSWLGWAGVDWNARYGLPILKPQSYLDLISFVK